MWRDRQEMTTRLKLAFLGAGLLAGVALVAIFGRH